MSVTSETVGGVLWDLDGTLIDSAGHHWIAWRDTLAAFGRSVTPGDFARLVRQAQRRDPARAVRPRDPDGVDRARERDQGAGLPPPAARAGPGATAGCAGVVRAPAVCGLAAGPGVLGPPPEHRCGVRVARGARPVPRHGRFRRRGGPRQAGPGGLPRGRAAAGSAARALHRGRGRPRRARGRAPGRACGRSVSCPSTTRGSRPTSWCPRSRRWRRTRSRSCSPAAPSERRPPGGPARRSRPRWSRACPCSS